MMSKMDRFLAIKWSQQFLEILHDYEGIIVSLEEPVKLLPVVLVAVLESALKKGVNLNLINFNLNRVGTKKRPSLPSLLL